LDRVGLPAARRGPRPWRSIRLGFLGGSLFAAKTSIQGCWISLDFLGFSRQNRDLSMGYTRFSLNKFFLSLFPVSRIAETGARGRGMRKRRIAHQANLNQVLLFRKKMSTLIAIGVGALRRGKRPRRTPKRPANSYRYKSQKGGQKNRQGVHGSNSARATAASKPPAGAEHNLPIRASRFDSTQKQDALGDSARTQLPSR
jgi:hypothetical protein